MKYKNIVFDFGNVIGRFDGKAILSEFCPHEEELDYLSEIVYKRWAELDAGTLDYDSYINEVIDQVPEHLKDCIRRFAKEWPRCTALLPDTITFIHELKERNIPIYLLSNAPTYFAEYYEGSELLSQFDGILFSGPIRLAKPSPEIYSHFLRKFDLKAEECFFIDDLEPNINAAKEAGMGGLVFTGDINEVKKQLVSDPIAFLFAPAFILYRLNALNSLCASRF